MPYNTAALLSTLNSSGPMATNSPQQASEPIVVRQLYASAAISAGPPAGLRDDSLTTRYAASGSWTSPSR